MIYQQLVLYANVKIAGFTFLSAGILGFLIALLGTPKKDGLVPTFWCSNTSCILGIFSLTGTSQEVLGCGFVFCCCFFSIWFINQNYNNRGRRAENRPSKELYLNVFFSGARVFLGNGRPEVGHAHVKVSCPQLLGLLFRKIWSQWQHCLYTWIFQKPDFIYRRIS